MTPLAYVESLIILAAYCAAGAGVGLLFFRGLWWNTRLIVEGGRVSTLVAMTLGRFLAMGGLLTLTAFEGAGPLLAAALGVFGGRFLVLRAIAGDEP